MAKVGVSLKINVSNIDHGSKCKKDEIGLTQQEIWEKKYK